MTEHITLSEMAMVPIIGHWIFRTRHDSLGIIVSIRLNQLLNTFRMLQILRILCRELSALQGCEVVPVMDLLALLQGIAAVWAFVIFVIAPVDAAEDSWEAAG